jgi:glycosyltransferase involved in cell wall biosynthesis
MKIAAVLENDIQAGGGFSMSLDLLTIIKEASLKSNSEFLIINFHKKNSYYLNKLNLQHVNISESIFDKIFAFINSSLLGAYFFNKLRISTFFENKLLKYGVDFVFFVTPSPKPFYLQQINYAITIYDICHKEYPEFSEVNSYNIFYLREKILQHCLGPSTYVITESEKLKKQIASTYQKDEDRIISIPNRPSPLLKYDKKNFKSTIFEQLPKNYFFYPAQFWEHKNHIKILYAIDKLKNSNIDFNIVFCGMDKGNLKNINKAVEKLNLQKNIFIFDFLTHEQVSELYQNAIALLMPTYFGPTNYPPLEAWAYGIPVIYSFHLQEQTMDAAIYCDPDSEESIADCMLKIQTDVNLRTNLIKNGHKMLKLIELQRKNSLNQLVKKIVLFKNRSKTWGSL